MRRLFLLAAVFAALAFASSVSASTIFVVHGRGWGHGVGMSQWGAYGRAIGYGVDGPQGYKRILGFYFRNTTVETRPSKRIHVLIYDHRKSIRIGSAAPFKVGSKSHAAGFVDAKPTDSGRIKIPGIDGSFASPVTVSPTTALLAIGRTRYRGKAILSLNGGHLRAVNSVGLEPYVKGVVPRESPDSWGASGGQAALEAQAVAARSYALASGGHCGAGLFCSGTSDQVYGGYDAEVAAPHATAAVETTAHEVVVSSGSGAVAQTFFSSSNGGYEAASADVWGGTVSYLRARRDPADLVPANPNRYWEQTRTPRGLARELGIGRPHDVSVARNGSGRASAVAFAVSGGTATLAGTTVQTRLGLRSTRYWIGIQSLTANRRRSTCKQRVTLTVFAHGVGSVSLQQRPVTDGSWSNVALTNVDATHWTARRRPCVSMDYRIVSHRATGGKFHLAVSPAVGIETVRATFMSGHVNPLLPGVNVTIQRRTSSGWTNAKTTPIQSDGSFRAEFNVAAGRYRAKVVPPSSTGLVTGYSPVLEVVT
jgi:stage II sporulation protein D